MCRANIKVAWIRYFCGDNLNHLPPLRQVMFQVVLEINLERIKKKIDQVNQVDRTTEESCVKNGTTVILRTWLQLLMCL